MGQLEDKTWNFHWDSTK